MPTVKQQYVKKLEGIAGRYRNLEKGLVSRMYALLRQARREVAAELMDAASWKAVQWRELQRNIGRLMMELQDQLGIELMEAIPQVHTMGGISVVEPLQALGVSGVFHAPNLAQVNTLLDFSVDLVQTITNQYHDMISTQVRIAALGQQSPMDAMKAITQKAGLVPGKPTEGVAYNAERIVRTELQRVYNLSSHAQQQVTAEQIPNLRKSWIATGDSRTRPGHLRIHHETRREPIPVKSKYKVYDIDDKGRVKGSALLRYPGDPAAPPQYTINCRCRERTVHPEFGVIGGSMDARVEKEVSRRNL